MSAPTVVILAAGLGTRMRSAQAKALHDLCGRPLVAWPVAAALESGATKVIVVDGPERVLDGRLPDGVELAVQAEPRGTADAVRAAAELIDASEDVIVLAGDVPLITPEFLSSLHAAHAANGAAATVATVVLDDASGYGRVVRDDAGQIERVVETKVPGDATDEELAIREVNTSIYAFDGGSLLEALSQVRSENAQGEYYLTDVIPLLRGGGAGVAAFTTDDPALLLGVNDRAGLAAAGAEAQRRIHERHMLAGVTIVEPASTSIDIDVEIGADTVIEPCSQLRGKTRVGSGATVGPHSTLIDALIGDGSRVIHSHLERCELRSGVSVGPFAYLRPETLLREGAKAGTFVEIKNSDIGERAKVPHLSYIGDADVGQDTNLGASSITANYDGRAKHRTTIGSRVHGAVHTSYVAPVTVGDDAYTGAGSVVTHDVPPGALAIARARQQNIEDYAGRRPEVPEAEQGPVKEEASDPGAEGKSDP